jgi:16S rRNA (guanine966-N2)-methyltransferase
VVFLDPPYPTPDEEVDANLDRLDGDWVVPGGLVVVERSSRSRAPRWPEGYVDTRERKYGETTLWYGHAAASR